MLVSWKRALAKLGVSRGFALAAVVARRFSDTLASKLAALAAGGGGMAHNASFKQGSPYMLIFPRLAPPRSPEGRARRRKAGKYKHIGRALFETGVVWVQIRLSTRAEKLLSARAVGVRALARSIKNP